MDWKDKLDALKNAVPQVDNVPEAVIEKEPADNRKKQTLRVELDKRNGKPATLITEFEGTEDELKDLSKILKAKCASGGSQRDGEILIQGDFRVKIAVILQEMGFKVKKINFK